jgi:hypothetical protein
MPRPDFHLCGTATRSAEASSLISALRARLFLAEQPQGALA